MIMIIKWDACISQKSRKHFNLHPLIFCPLFNIVKFETMGKDAAPA